MSTIKRISLEEVKSYKISKERLKEMEKQKDDQIDFSDIPPLTGEELKQMRPAREVHPEWFKPKKTKVSLMLDTDLLNALKSEGKGYQTKINKILREYVFG